MRSSEQVTESVISFTGYYIFEDGSTMHLLVSRFNFFDGLYMFSCAEFGGWGGCCISQLQGGLTWLGCEFIIRHWLAASVTHAGVGREVMVRQGSRT